MKRGIVVVVLCVVGAALASCKGSGGKQRVPDGEKASAAFLIRTIDAVRGIEDREALLLLGEGVSEVCGKGCACLAAASRAEAGDKAAAIYGCPSVCTPDARAKAAAAPASERLAALATACTPEAIGLTASTAAKVGDDWLVAFVSGQYLADAYDGANADDRKAYETAFADFTVPLAPTAAMAGVSAARATHAGELGRARTFVIIDAKGALRAGTMHAARFTPKGADYVAATTQDFPDAVALGKKLHEVQSLGLQLGDATKDDALAKAPPVPDAPPPPEPDEDEDEDDDDEATGGTGTAMALDEGRMGKKDSGRAEGQYVMKRNDTAPQLARQQAIEQARQAGILGDPDLAQGGAFASLTGTGDLSSGLEDVDLAGGLLGPAYSVLGLASTPVDDQVVVMADRDAPAKVLLEVLSAIHGGAVVAIEHEGRLAALPLVFDAGGLATLGNRSGAFGEDPVELVVEVTADAFTVNVTRTGDVTEVKGGDTAALQAAVTKQLEGPLFIDRRDVKITARDDARIAQLVPAIDAALGAGARAVRLQTPAAGGGTGWGTIGSGRYGTIGPSGSLRSGNTSVPSVSIGQAATVGDLDKAIIRRYIKRSIPKIQYCYEKELLTKPKLQGTVTTKFFITPNGDVASVSATGVDDVVASCVAAVIKGTTFPKPKGGGGVQVTYPFNFRAAGG